MKKDKKILLIEDDKGFRAAILENFKDTEFIVITAEDGEQGLLKAKTENPDFILLDIVLPKMDGITVSKKLKQEGVKIPIMYLTNINSDERIYDAMTVGGGEMDYIVKTDVRVEDIIDRIRKRLDIKK